MSSTTAFDMTETCKGLLVCSLWAIILFALGPNEYVRETNCTIIDYSYERDYGCDVDDGDTGIYYHHLTFTQECNQIAYTASQECAGYYTYYEEIGNVHRCWTNTDCSIQALWSWNGGLTVWFYSIAPYLAYFFSFIACIYLIQLIVWTLRGCNLIELHLKFLNKYFD